MNVQRNVPLKEYTSYKIGGPAKYFIEIQKSQELEEINIKEYKSVFVLGGGSNLLIPDEGFDGLVLLNKIGEIEKNGNFVHVGSGVEMSDLLGFCIENSLSGLEWAGGLPGTIGGAVRGNAGAFGGETKDNVFEVESFNLKTKKLSDRKNKDCEFGYRMSFFKKNPNEIITSAVLKLSIGDKQEIGRKIMEKIDYRNLKHPMDYPNVGSTFKNISLDNVSDKQREEFASFIKNDPFPVVAVTKLLALAGLKGIREGDAQISEKHPNFIVNLGNAKSSDVLKLVHLAKKTIKEKWGIDLEEEIQILN